MQNFELTKHQVTEVNYKDNGRAKDGESSFDISGSVLLPKDGKGIIFEQEVQLGKPGENVYLYLKTLTFFAQIDASKPFVLDEANKECYPMAEKLLKETIRNVTESFGMPIIDLMVEAETKA